MPGSWSPLRCSYHQNNTTEASEASKLSLPYTLCLYLFLFLSLVNDHVLWPSVKYPWSSYLHKVSRNPDPSSLKPTDLQHTSRHLPHHSKHEHFGHQLLRNPRVRRRRRRRRQRRQADSAQPLPSPPAPKPNPRSRPSKNKGQIQQCFRYRYLHSHEVHVIETVSTIFLILFSREFRLCTYSFVALDAAYIHIGVNNTKTAFYLHRKPRLMGACLHGGQRISQSFRKSPNGYQSEPRQWLRACEARGAGKSSSQS